MADEIDETRLRFEQMALTFDMDKMDSDLLPEEP